MALATVTSGSNATALSVQQIINLLTGVMTDQAVYIANTIRAGATGATTFAAFAGGVSSGAPASGTHAVGEFILDITNQIIRMCSIAGTPGTWVAVGTQTDTTAGDYVGLVAAGAASVAGAVGKAADAGHQHPALVNAGGGFSGNLFQGQLAGVDKFKVDQTGLITATSITLSGNVGAATGAFSGAVSMGSISQSGQTLSLPALVQAETLAVRGTFADNSPANPTTSNSNAYVMQGCADTFTPKVTGRVLVIICGSAYNSTVDVQTWVAARFGSGGAPTHGAADTGTVLGAQSERSFFSPSANVPVPFTIAAVVSGLAINTTYWFDLALKSVSNDVIGVNGLSFTILEV